MLNKPFDMMDAFTSKPVSASKEATEYNVQDCADRIYDLDKDGLTKEEYLAKVQSIVLMGMSWSHLNQQLYMQECAAAIGRMTNQYKRHRGIDG